MRAVIISDEFQFGGILSVSSDCGVCRCVCFAPRFERGTTRWTIDTDVSVDREQAAQSLVRIPPSPHATTASRL